jgi:hypothetical protein
MVQEKGQEQQELGATWHLHAKDEARCGVAEPTDEHNKLCFPSISLAWSHHLRLINGTFNAPGVLARAPWGEMIYFCHAMMAEMTDDRRDCANCPPRRIHDHGKAPTMVSEGFTQSPCRVDGSRISWAPRVCIRRQPPGKMARQTAVNMPRRQDPIRRPTRNFLWPFR